MYQQEEIERKLRIDRVVGLPKEFIQLSNKLATKFLADIYIYEDDIFKVSEEMVRNRIQNLMKEQLLENPEMTAKEFQSTFVLKRTFFDLEAMNFLVELAGEDNNMYFQYSIPFLAVKVKATLVDVRKENRFLPVDELQSVLYKACDDTIKACAKKGSPFFFSNLERFMKGEINQLMGFYQPFGLSRSRFEDFHKFMSLISSHEFTCQDAETIAKLLTTRSNPISVKKVQDLFYYMEVTDGKNFISMQAESYHEKYKEPEYKEGNTSFNLDEVIEKLNLKDDWELLVVDYFRRNENVKITAELEELTGMSRHKIGKVRDKLVEELRHYVRIQESEPTKKDSETKTRLEPIE